MMALKGKEKLEANKIEELSEDVVDLTLIAFDSKVGFDAKVSICRAESRETGHVIIFENPESVDVSIDILGEVIERALQFPEKGFLREKSEKMKVVHPMAPAPEEGRIERFTIDGMKFAEECNTDRAIFRIVQLNHPLEIFVHPLDLETALYDLQDSINAYIESGNCETMHGKPNPGDIVLTPTENGFSCRYARAKVVCLKEKEKVSVELVDYGSTGEVDCDQLRYPTKEIYNVPVLGIGLRVGMELCPNFIEKMKKVKEEDLKKFPEPYEKLFCLKWDHPMKEGDIKPSSGLHYNGNVIVRGSNRTYLDMVCEKYEY